MNFMSVDHSLALCKERNIFVLFHFCAENMRWFWIACKKSRRYSKIMIVTVLEEDDEGDADIIRVLRKI